MTLAEDDAPVSQVATPAAPATRARNAVYESAGHTRRTIGWQAPTVGANDGLLGNLTTLRDRSRAAVRNDGIAKNAIERLVSNIIGTGIKPQSLIADEALRREVHELWLRWTDESDADGLLDWYGQQAQATRAWLEGGECFIRLRPRRAEDGLAVPLQVQVIEPELCPHDHDVIRTTRGTRIRAGIEFNQIGKRIAYLFYRSRPGDAHDYLRWELRAIGADSVVHLFDPLRPGQIRGLPHLTQALIRLVELDKFDDATLLRQQLANLFVAFVKRAGSLDAELTNPITGLSATATTERQRLGLEPGIFQELDVGEDVTFSDPPSVGETYPDFMRQQLFGVSAATGVPYEVLTGDMSKVNDRTVRVILQEFRRRVMAIQHQLIAHRVCRAVWHAWMDKAFYTGALRLPADYATNPEPYRAVKWVPQGWPYLHPLQDVQASKERMRAGLSSRSMEVSELGEDAEQIDQEQAADNARADALGLRYDSDGRHTAARARGAAANNTTGAGDDPAQEGNAA